MCMFIYTSSCSTLRPSARKVSLLGNPWPPCGSYQRFSLKSLGHTG